MVKAQVKTGPQVKPKRVRKSDLEKEVAMLEIEHVRALFFFVAISVHTEQAFLPRSVATYRAVRGGAIILVHNLATGTCQGSLDRTLLGETRTLVLSVVVSLYSLWA
jgi:hypothetical protein